MQEDAIIVHETELNLAHHVLRAGELPDMNLCRAVRHGLPVDRGWIDRRFLLATEGFDRLVASQLQVADAALDHDGRDPNPGDVLRDVPDRIESHVIDRAGDDGGGTARLAD